MAAETTEFSDTPARRPLADAAPWVLAALALSGALVAAMVLARSCSGFADGLVRVATPVTLLAGLASAAAIIRGDTFGRRATALAIVGAATVFLVARLGGYEPSNMLWPDARFIAFALAATASAGVGVLRRRRWGRWLAMSLAATATGAALVGLFAPEPWLVWQRAVLAVLGTLVLANLIGPAMAASDVQTDDFAHGWRRGLPLSRWLAVATVSTFVTVPTLLHYAWVEPLAMEDMRVPALLVAAMLAAAAYLTTRNLTAGAIALTAAGGVHVVLAVALPAQAVHPYELNALIPYLPLWLAAAGLTFMAGTSIARALSRAAAEEG